MHIQNPGKVSHIHVYCDIVKIHGLAEHIQNRKHIEQVSGTLFRY